MSVLVLIAAAIFLLVYARNNDVVSVYDSAPVCSDVNTALRSQACRYQSPALVVREYRSDRLMVVVALAAVPGRNFNTSFPVDHEPAAGSVNEGSSPAAELWNGRITRLAGKRTFDNPQERPTTSLLVAAPVLGALGLLMLLLSGSMAVEARLLITQKKNDRPV